MNDSQLPQNLIGTYDSPKMLGRSPIERKPNVRVYDAVVSLLPRESTYEGFSIRYETIWRHSASRQLPHLENRPTSSVD